MPDPQLYKKSAVQGKGYGHALYSLLRQLREVFEARGKESQHILDHTSGNETKAFRRLLKSVKMQKDLRKSC